MEWFLKVVKEHYADFNGRARRKEYWMFTLIQLIIVYSLMGIGAVLEISILSTIGSIISLALLLPSIGVGVRRLHDIDKSGWFLLLAFVPLANFYLLFLLASDSTPGENEYGANPKGIGNNEDISKIGNE